MAPVYTTAKPSGAFSVSTRVPRAKAAATYPIYLRCGGATVGGGRWSSRSHAARCRSARVRSPPGTPSPCPDGFPRPRARNAPPVSPCCPTRSSTPTTSRTCPPSGRPSSRMEPLRSPPGSPAPRRPGPTTSPAAAAGEHRGLGDPGGPGRAAIEDHLRRRAARPAGDPPQAATPSASPADQPVRQHPIWSAAGSSPGWPPFAPARRPPLACGCTDVGTSAASAARSGPAG